MTEKPTPKVRIAGVAEAAELLGVPKQAIADRRRYRRLSFDVRPEFPKPIAELACGPIWLLSDLKRYKRQYASFARRG